MEYNKLVRDKIPEIIKRDNKEPVIHLAEDKEYSEKLIEKLKEEVNEFAESLDEKEFVDILEVMEAISKFEDFDVKELDKLKKDKSEKRGKFDKKIILDRID